VASSCPRWTFAGILLTSFFWTFERPFPCREYAEIHFSLPWEERSDHFMQGPVILKLSGDLSLRVLDLADATLF